MQAVIEFPGFRPEIFSITLFGVELALRWYALAYIAGLVAGWRIVIALISRGHLWPGGQPPLTRAQTEDLLTAIVLGVVLGGRLGFALFYEPAYYLSHPIEILKVWQGGMSFHGGFLGVVVAGIWFCRRHGLSMLSVGDALAVAVPAGLLLGRIANFINAELWGRPSTLPWAVVFPGEAAQDCPGVIGACARHPSQLYEAGLEGLLLGLVLLAVVRAGGLLRPGLAMGVFVAGYGLSRFLVEFVRQADARFITPDNPLGYVVQFAGAGLSMGQMLSLPMVGAGLWLAWRARRA